jgi:ABC-2 type transport system permease protein
MAGSSLRNKIKLYFTIIKLLIRSRTTYRLDFAGQLLSEFLSETAQIALIWVVMQRFHSLGGWSMWEVGVLYALSSLVGRMFVSFLGGARSISQKVVAGDLDEFLITPTNPLFLINAYHSVAWRFYYNVSVFLIFIICANRAGIPLSARTIVLFALFFVSSTLILYSLYLIAGTVSFWILKTEALTQILDSLMNQFVQFPIHIYGRVIGLIFTFLVPIGFITYYPSALLLSKIENVMISPYIGYFSPLIAFILLIVSYKFWKFGLNRYCSTGT